MSFQKQKKSRGEYCAKIHFEPNRLEQDLDLSKNVLDQAKRDLGNSPLRANLIPPMS